MADTTTQKPERRKPGAEELVSKLVEEHARSLYRQAVSIVRDHALAEDVVQETLLRAWLGYDSYRGEGSIRAWVMRIGHNVAISTLRKRRDEVTDPTELPESITATLPNQVADRLAIEAISSALDNFDELSRAIVVMRDVEGYSYAEIAEITGSTVATVKTRLFRTRRRLADSLEDWR